MDVSKVSDLAYGNVARVNNLRHLQGCYMYGVREYGVGNANNTIYC